MCDVKSTGLRICNYFIMYENAQETSLHSSSNKDNTPLILFRIIKAFLFPPLIIPIINSRLQFM